MYNSSAHKLEMVTTSELCKIGLKTLDEIPLNGTIWKPSVDTTKYSAWYYVNVIFLHLFPALLIDGLLKLSGKKPLCVNMHCIIYVHIYSLLIILFFPTAGVTLFQMM